LTDHLVAPHGGILVDLLVDSTRAAELRAVSRDWPSWDLTPRQLCDLELLLNGGFSPLKGFMTRRDVDRVCSDLRLADGTLWPIPITLDIPEVLATRLRPHSQLALRDPEGVMLAVLHVADVWRPDRTAEAETVYGTTNCEHPGVAWLFANNGWYVGGRVEGLQLPTHYDYRTLRLSPLDLRKKFSRLGWRQVVAFQTRNPMHRAHQELTLRGAKEVGANLLIHPVVGITKPGDIDHHTRVRCYQALLPTYPAGMAMLSLLPLTMRLGGPRETLWHAIIRKNYGCTHFIVGRDHAGPGKDSSGKAFYGPYDAQEMLRQYERELGVTMVRFREMSYVADVDKYFPEDEVPSGTRTLSISGTELRSRLADGREIPDWFTFPQVTTELRKLHPPRYRQGCTIFLTGLSGAGKSTIANVLWIKFLELGDRPVTLLDGDLVRKHLSSELGFSREHRDINIRRIGYVASEITKNGGVAICAPIAPYESVRNEVRQMIEPIGGFILVYVATPLEVCEQRDRKGLYAKARAGLIKEFTGISDPYEPPAVAQVVIDTTSTTAEDAAQQILVKLEEEGYIGASATSLPTDQIQSFDQYRAERHSSIDRRQINLGLQGVERRSGRDRRASSVIAARAVMPALPVEALAAATHRHPAPILSD
jgi:sulfate adenylyltransferase